MISLLQNLFSETGSISMMRVLAFLCVLTAIGIAITALIRGSDLSSAAVLCGTFLGVGVGGKLMQKGMEVRRVVD